MSLHRRSPRRLATALGPIRAQAAPQTALAEVQAVWRAAVGEVIAAEAVPASERGGVLTVACSSAGWAQELDLLAPEIINTLNSRLQRASITALRCSSTAS